MTKENWLKHIETSEGLTRPSNGGNITVWKDAIKMHMETGCKECKARQKTNAATRRRKEREYVMESLGLTKVKGPVSGKTYWE